MLTLSRRLIGIGAIAIAIIVAFSSGWVHWESRSHITPDAARQWVIVLGDRVRDGKPSVYLQERLETTLTILRENRAQRVLLSGHAGSTKGNEVSAMRDYLVERGVDAGAITDDRFGVTTYQTCARAKSVFEIEGAILVTQDFHLRRAVALCRTEGIDAVGAEADSDAGVYLTVRNWFREIALSRPKAVLDAFHSAGPDTRQR